MRRSKFVRSAVTCAAVTSLAPLLMAQHPLQSDAQVVAVSGGAVPGLTGATFVASATFDTPVVDANGDVMFRAQFVGGGATSSNDRAYFHGSPSSLAFLARAGDQAPGLPSGITLNSTTGGSGLTSICRISPAGHALFVSSIWNGGVTSSNDTALFAGQLGNLTVLAREGDPAPGTVGATFSTNFASTTTFVTTGALGANASGQYLIKSLLAGGDVSGSTNNDGWWVGPAGALQLLVRKGEVMPGPGGFALGTLVGPAQNFAKLNGAGQVLWEAQYTSTVGSPLPTSNDNQVLYLSTVGNHVVIAREGNAVPGLGGSIFYGASGGISTFGATGTSLDASGNVLFKTDLRGSVTTDDDQAVLYCPFGGSPSVVFRENDAAPGLVNAQFAATFNSTLQMNDSGRFVIVATLRGTGVTTANDGSLWSGIATTAGGALQCIAREGDVAVGTAAATYGSFSTNVLGFNNADQLVFQVSLVGGDVATGVNDSALYAWTPTGGLVLLSRKGDSMPQLGGAAVTAWSFFQNDNGATSNLGFNQSGRLALRLSLGTATQAIVVFDLKPEPVNYCSGGLTSNGCVATIHASANPNVAHSGACNITVSNVEGQKTGLVFYGVARNNAAWCSPGSSFLCVKSPTQRTSPHSSGGTAGACDGTLSLDWNAFQVGHPSSLGQPFAAGAVVDLQAWFRDPPACKTTNTSNAVEMTYQP